MPGAGHWLMEEAPGFVIPKLVEFLGRGSLQKIPRRHGAAVSDQWLWTICQSPPIRAYTEWNSSAR